MKEEQILAIKSMVYGQAFVDTLDKFKGTNAFRQKLKMRSKQFNAEVEKFLDTAYCGGDTDTNVIELLEECEKAIDGVLEKVTVKE